MHMSNDHIKSQLVSTIGQCSQVTNQLPLHPLQKIEICQWFIFSKLKWQFSIYNLTKTWVAETLDNKFSKFYCRWLQIPVSRNISHLLLPRSKLMNAKLTTEVFWNVHLMLKPKNYMNWHLMKTLNMTV